MPVSSTAKVWPVTGTGVQGNGIAIRAATAVTRLAPTISRALRKKSARGSAASASVRVRTDAGMSTSVD